MANTNFKVKTGLEVGTAITISSGNITATAVSIGGSITAGSFYGDGSNLTNAGSFLTAASGSQRVVLTSLTTGTMTSAATNSDLLYDSSTNTLTCTNISIGGTLTYEDVTNIDSIGIVTARSGVRINNGGLDVVGISTFNDNVEISSSNALSFNNSSLSISHSGGDANILNSSGDLILGADNNRDIRLERVGIATLGRFTHGGSVELYYNGNKKFETTDDGVTVTGTNFTNQLSVSGVGTITTLSATDLTVNDINVSGIVTSTEFDISTNSNSLSATGLTVNDINVSGIVTSTEFDITTSSNSLSATGLTANNINVSGIGTITTLTATTLRNYSETVNNVGNTGTAATINLANGNFVTATLTGNCTFTFTTGLTSGAISFTLVLTNDGTAGRSIIWPPSVKWPNNVIPTRTTTANRTDVYTFFTYNNGTTWWGNLSLYNYS